MWDGVYEQRERERERERERQRSLPCAFFPILIVLFSFAIFRTLFVLRFAWILSLSLVIPGCLVTNTSPSLKHNSSTSFLPYRFSHSTLRAKRHTEQERNNRDNDLGNDEEGFESRVALARSAQSFLQLRALFRGGEAERVMGIRYAEHGEQRDGFDCDPED